MLARWVGLLAHAHMRLRRLRWVLKNIDANTNSLIATQRALLVLVRNG